MESEEGVIERMVAGLQVTLCIFCCDFFKADRIQPDLTYLRRKATVARDPWVGLFKNLS